MTHDINLSFRELVARVHCSSIIHLRQLSRMVSRILGSFAGVAALILAVPLCAQPQTNAGSSSATLTSLPDAPDSQSLLSGPILQLDSVGEDTLASDCLAASPVSSPCAPHRFNWFQRFTKGPKWSPLTPRDKAWLAARNFLDPFSLLAVVGEAGISVAVDSHSPYGPGIPGFGRSVGVSVAEDMTGEFFGTFLIPSVVHQDPHYYRMEHAPIHRRIGHAVVQVFWTRSDNGKGMPNYANLVGFAFDDAIANLYVPGRETSLGASAATPSTLPPPPSATSLANSSRT